jgi:hypothetical protein
VLTYRDCEEGDLQVEAPQQVCQVDGPDACDWTQLPQHGVVAMVIAKTTEYHLNASEATVPVEHLPHMGYMQSCQLLRRAGAGGHSRGAMGSTKLL